MPIILMVIGGYWWLLCYKPLLVILLVVINDQITNAIYNMWTNQVFLKGVGWEPYSMWIKDW
jgi:hypothetical protein